MITSPSVRWSIAMSHLTCSLRRLAAAALLIATGVAAAESTWRDNFDQGQQLPWTSVRGNWIASDGTYAAQQPGSSPVTAALLPYDLSDFSIEVDLIQPVDGGLWLRANADATSGVLLVVFANRMYWHVIADPVTGPWTIHGFAWISPALGSGANRIRVTGATPREVLQGCCRRCRLKSGRVPSVRWPTACSTWRRRRRCCM
ncbi:MAG TPA: hypothetical protein PKY22_09875, partial [Accumulibacter sp.]|nr:hypothetical protein [Accumulibacter sp.]